MAYGTLGQIGIPLDLAQMGRSITVIGSGIDDINMGERIKPLMEKGAALGFSTALAKALFHTFQGNLSGIRFTEIKMAGLLQIGGLSVIGVKQQGDAVVYAGNHNALSGGQIPQEPPQKPMATKTVSTAGSSSLSVFWI